MDPWIRVWPHEAPDRRDDRGGEQRERDEVAATQLQGFVVHSREPVAARYPVIARSDLGALAPGNGISSRPEPRRA